MQCPLCQAETRRFGRNRNGSQRYRCDACRRTFTDESTRPTDRRCLDQAKLILCLRMLLEGNSIRSVERLTCVHRDTIIAAMVAAGQRCQAFMETAIHGVQVNDVEADEIWGFIGCKERTREIRGHGQDKGDAYCFTAIERTSKLILTFHLGKRCPEDTMIFANKLWHATSGKFQLTTDGFTPYLTAVPFVFGRQLDFATLVKVYGTPTEEDSRRYSPGRITDVVPTPRTGNPDPDRICTSFVERSNLTIRMSIRRMTRLTNGFSKKWDNHEAALSLFFAYYNFCRVHSTIKTTPAAEAGLTDHVWSVQELLEKASQNG
jgi:transposase-like protein/IS1 family transposase